MPRKPKYGFRCQSCGDQGKKLLYGVEVKWVGDASSNKSKGNISEYVTGVPIIRNINICKRCMRRFGLMEKDDSTRNQFT